MWAKKPMQAESVAEVYQRAGVPLAPANNERVIGWQRMRHYLAPQADGKPALIFFATCREAIRTIPACVFDDKNPEDIDTDGEDHAADECRYFCMAAGAFDHREVQQPTTTSYSYAAEPEDNPFDSLFGAGGLFRRRQ